VLASAEAIQEQNAKAQRGKDAKRETSKKLDVLCGLIVFLIFFVPLW
jgi:hypothetical protein